MQNSRKPRASILHVIPHFSSLRRKCASDARIRAALEYVEAHALNRRFHTSSLSDHLNLSPSRVQHLFQQHLGMSPTQVFKLRQLERAKYLLDTTFLLIKEVMAEIGRNDLSHFVRDYKKIYGHTPVQRRKQLGKHRKSPTAYWRPTAHSGFLRAARAIIQRAASNFRDSDVPATQHEAAVAVLANN